MTAATWPVGMLLTSWDYMWRCTPMHRRESEGTAAAAVALLTLPSGVSGEDVQGQESGYGLLFHRRYGTRIRGSEAAPEELMDQVKRNLNKPAPTAFARFQKVLGDDRGLAVGDEYVVRMPGPWDGPVRVIDAGALSFRLATLAGHLEAGQIEFRAGIEGDGHLKFEIESWARSSSWFSNLLYRHLRMAKEVQAHMWISFLEGVVRLSGGRMTGGVEMETRRISEVRDGR